MVALGAAAGCSSRNFQSPTSIDTTPQLGAIKGVVVLASATESFPALLPDVDVAITQPDGIQLHTVTTSQGVFTFGNLPAGSYALVVNVNPAPGAPTLFAPTTSVGSVTVTASKTTDVGTISPTYVVGTPAATKDQVEVYGLVRANLHVDGGIFTFDGGFDLSGTQVTVYFAGDESQPFLVTFTQADGTFGQLLPAGTYDLKATNHLFVPGVELGVVIGLDGGGSDAGFETLPQPIVMAINPASITGNVQLEVDPALVDGGSGTGAAFAPVAGVTATTLSGGVGVTDATGAFIINDLLGQPDQVSFVAPSNPVGETYHTNSPTFSVPLQPGDNTTMPQVQMFLDRGTVTGKVKMLDNTAALGVTVTLLYQQQPVAAAVVSPEADPSIGDFSFPNIPVHPNYQVVAAAPHYNPAAPVGVPGAFLGNGATADVGTIPLSPQQGQFVITSTNPLSHPGFTNTTSVFVFVQGAAAGATQLRLSESANFDSPDGGSAAWTTLVTTSPGNAFNLSNSDGLHTVYAQYQVPASGSMPASPGPILSSSILLDRVRPTNASVATTTGKTFVNTNQDISITLIATDPNETSTVPASGLGSMVVAEDFSGSDLDGGLLTAADGGLDLVPYAAYGTFPPNASILADGPYTIYAQFFDNAGNASAIVSSRLVVDTVPPTGSLTITSLTASSPGYTNSPLVTINELFGLPDGGTGSAPAEPYGGTDSIQLSNDANTVANAAPLPASGAQTWSLDTSSGDGSKTVYMLITDSAGNVSNSGTPYQAKIFLERQAPAGTVDLIAPSAAGPASVNPTSTDATTVTLEYALNPGTASDPGATGIEVSEQPTACSALPVTTYQPASGSSATLSYTFAAALSDGGGGIQDGNKVIFSCLRNAAGNTTQLETQVVLNRQDPVGSVTVGNGSAFQDDGSTTSVTLSGFSSDVVGVEVSTSPLSCDGGSGSFQAFNPSNPVVEVATPTDGSYTVYTCIEDAAGNITSLPPFTFTKDSSVPTGTISIEGQLADHVPSTTVTANQLVTLQLSASAGPGDAVLSMQVANDSVGNLANAIAQPYSPSLTWELSNGDGVKQVFVQFTDEAGRTSLPVSAQISLDTSTPPVAMAVVANGVANPSATNANSVQVEFTIAAGANLPIEVALFPSQQNCTTVTSYGPMPAGTPPTETYALLDGLFPDGGGGPLPDGGALVNDQVTLFACFEDSAGNTSSAIATFEHDTIPPSGTASFGTGQAIQPSGAQNLIVTSSDATSMLVSTTAINCQTAAASSFTPFNTSTPETLANGNSSLYVCLRDAAGNVAAATPFPVTVDVDSTTPTGTVSIQGQLANHTLSTTLTASSQVSVSVTASAGAGDSVVSMQVANDSAANLATAVAQPLTPAFSWQLSSGDGVKQVFVQFTDQAGRVSAPISASITLDTSSPPVSMTIVANGVSNPQATNANSIQIQYTVGPSAHLPLEVALSAGPQNCTTATGYTAMPAGSPPTQTFALTDGLYPDAGGPLPDGGALINEEVTLFACFQDPAGNTSSAIATFQHDTIPPSGTATFGNGQAVQGSGAQNLIVSASAGTTEMYVSTTAVTCSSVAAGSFVPFTTSTAETLANGSSSLYVCLRDLAGNVAPVSPFPVTVDVDSSTPTGTVSIQGQLANNTLSTTLTATPQVSVSVTASAGAGDSVVSMQVANDSAANLATAVAQPLAPTFSWQLSSGDGVKQVYVQFTDQAGKVSAPISASITLDTSSPPVSMTVVANGVSNPQATNANSVQVQYTVGPSAHLPLQVALADSPQNCATATGYVAMPAGSPPTQTFVLTDGLYPDAGGPLPDGGALVDDEITLVACFEDPAGNTSSASDSFEHDTIPPTATATFGNGQAVQGSGAQNLIVSASAGTTEMYVSTASVTCSSVAAASFVPFATSTAETLPGGPNSLYVCLRDLAGNVASASPFPVTVDIDSTVPSGTLVIDGELVNHTVSTSVTSTPLVTLAITATAGSGDTVTEMLVANDSASNLTSAVWQPLESTLPWQLSAANGTKQVWIEFMDAAGRTSVPLSASITLTTVGPQNPSLSYVPSVAAPANCTPPTGTINNAKILVTAAASPPDGTIDLSDTSSFSDASTQLGLGSSISNQSFTFQGGDGPKTLFARFTDAAGNSVVTTASLVLDTTPPGSPVATIVQSPFTDTAAITVNLSATGSPASVSIAATEVGGAGSTTTTNLDFTGTAAVTVPSDVNGVKNIVATLFDQACNAAVAPTVSTTLDTVLPTGSVAISGTLGDGSTSATLTATTAVTLTLSASDTVAGESVPLMEVANDPSFGSAAWQAFSSPLAWTLSAGDGIKTVYVRYQNKAGSISATANASIQLMTSTTSAATVTLASTDPDAEAGFVSSKAPANNQVSVTLAASGSPTQYQLLTALAPDGGSTTGTWTNLPVGSGTWSLPTTTLAGAADGTENAYVFLRDQNLIGTGPFVGSITRLSTAPTITALAFPSASTGYTNSRTVAVNATLTSLASPETTPANDRYRVSCDASQPIASQPWTTLQSESSTVMQASCVLQTPDGSKTVTLQPMDQAGNIGTSFGASLTLVQTAPVAPTLSIPASASTLITGATSATTSLTSLAITVTASGTSYPSTSGSNGSTWGVSGGSAHSVSGSTVTFTLNPGSATADTGNTLQVWTIDAAGNVGPPATLSINQEVAGDPAAPTGFTALVRSGALELSWTASPSTFTTYYSLDYGTTTAYGGTFADQGASPLNLGVPCSGTSCAVTLSGLTNSTNVYVRLTPHSALQAGVPATLGPIVPQEVSASDLGGFNLRGVAWAMQVVDDRAYVVEGGNGGTNPACLEIVDLANPAFPAGPTYSLGNVSLAAYSPGATTSSIQVAWPYAYVGAGSTLLVINISTESGPTIVGSVAAKVGANPGSISAIDLAWPVVYANVFSSTGGVEIEGFNVFTPTAPTLMGQLATNMVGGYYQIGSIAVAGSTVFIGGSYGQLPDGGNNSTFETAPVATMNTSGGLVSFPTAITSASTMVDDIGAILVSPGDPWNVYLLDVNGEFIHTFQSIYSPEYGYYGTASMVPPYGAEVGGVGGSNAMTAMAFAGSDIVLAGGLGTPYLQIFDTHEPAAPYPAGSTLLTTVSADAVSVVNGIAWLGGAAPSSGTYTVTLGGYDGLLGAQTGRIEAFQLTHPGYPQVAGTTAAGVVGAAATPGGSHIQMRGPLALVGGGGLTQIDATNPAAPVILSSAAGNALLGGSLNNELEGGAVALDGQIALNAAYDFIDPNDVGAIVAYEVGLVDTSNCDFYGASCQGCALARYAAPANEYYNGVDARGEYVFAGRAGSSPYLDVFRLPIIGSGTCSDPPPSLTYLAGTPLTANPVDVQVHRNYVFVAEDYGSGSDVEIFDVTTPTSPVKKVTQYLPSDGLGGGGDFAESLSVRMGLCSGVDCYQIFVGALINNNPGGSPDTGEVLVYTWSLTPPLATSLTLVGHIQLTNQAPIYAVGVDYPDVLAGNFNYTVTDALGFGVFDITSVGSYPEESSISPIGTGQETFSLGAAGRFVYSDIAGTFVVTELQ